MSTLDFGPTTTALASLVQGVRDDQLDAPTPNEGRTVAALGACTRFVESFDAPREGELFGPRVAVPESASAVDRLIGATGRDPHWSPRSQLA